MKDLADRFAEEAERLIGTRFRLHGRDPVLGLDCIGVAACALCRAGAAIDAPTGYALRNALIQRHVERATASGLVEVTGRIRRGDILLVRTGPGQDHLLVAVGCKRFVHAHAGLRQVVSQTGLSGWTVRHHLRLTQ